MVLARWQATITDGAGNVIPLAYVEVRREAPGTPLAPIYSDRDGLTPEANAFQADAAGYAYFHAAGGAYYIKAYAAGFEMIWRYVAVGRGAESDLTFSRPRGEWDVAETYAIGDYVQDGGYLFISRIEDNQGAAPDSSTPGDTTEWMFAGGSIVGPPGAAATITVGSVTSVPFGDPVDVTNSGTPDAAILDFELPLGPTGAAGQDGTMASVVAGTGIDVDATDPANPIVKIENDAPLPGAPTVGTAAAGDDSTKVANTAFVQNARKTRVGSITSSSTPGPAGATQDQFNITAQAATATVAAPTGTPYDGQKLTMRIKDNGTSRTLNWNAIYRGGSDLALPSATVLSKTLYLGFIYNGADTKWDLVASLGGL